MLLKQLRRKIICGISNCSKNSLLQKRIFPLCFKKTQNMHSYQHYVKQPEKKSLVFIAAVVIGNKVKKKKMKLKATEGTRTIVLVGKKLVFWRIFFLKKKKKILPLVHLRSRHRLSPQVYTQNNLRWAEKKWPNGISTWTFKFFVSSCMNCPSAPSSTVGSWLSPGHPIFIGWELN